MGWFAHPIYSKTGDFPPVMRKKIEELSLEQGFKKSRLPTFSIEEIEYIRGTLGNSGINNDTNSKVNYVSKLKLKSKHPTQTLNKQKN